MKRKRDESIDTYFINHQISESYYFK